MIQKYTKKITKLEESKVYMREHTAEGMGIITIKTGSRCLVTSDDNHETSDSGNDFPHANKMGVPHALWNVSLFGRGAILDEFNPGRNVDENNIKKNS